MGNPLAYYGHWHCCERTCLCAICAESVRERNLCTLPQLSDVAAKKFRYAVANSYAAQMYIDDLPVMALIGHFENEDGLESDKPKEDARLYLWTHKKFTISFNKNQVTFSSHFSHSVRGTGGNFASSFRVPDRERYGRTRQ